LQLESVVAAVTEDLDALDVPQLEPIVVAGAEEFAAPSATTEAAASVKVSAYGAGERATLDSAGNAPAAATYSGVPEEEAVLVKDVRDASAGAPDAAFPAAAPFEVQSAPEEMHTETEVAEADAMCSHGEDSTGVPGEDAPVASANAAAAPDSMSLE
jgi:hypothetical protein